jgi:signal transduction histidine kinase
LRGKSFWAGGGGWTITTIIGSVLLALLVGWVLLWVSPPESPSIPLLTLGCIAFAVVLAVLATLQLRLYAHWRQRQVEAILLAGVSHDLRTPISAARAAAQALDSDRLEPEEQRQLVRAIVHETRRLELRVDNLLETGRLDVEQRRLRFDRLDFSSLIDRLVEGARPTIDQVDGSLETRVESEIWVQGDHRMLSLVVNNLLDNAMIHSDAAPRITVTLSFENGDAVLRVLDHGVGFETELAPLLFQRFHGGRGRTSGAGLGLALSRAIARGHGGDVQLESKGPGRGALAELRLPAAGVK